MAGEKKWITPLLKQLFVVTGVSLNMGSTGSVFGFPAILLPQLRAPDSDVPITSSEGTWIASILGFSLLAGNFMVPTLMGKFGRKLASLISCTVTLVCWIWIVLATDVTSLLIARFFQGLSVGINLSLAPIMIGEYTSPSNRGLFSSVMTSTITAQTLLVHVLGSYVTWRTTALVLAFTSCAGVAILIFSPESPSWLADRGKYKDSANAYKWLRGDGEDEELEKMLEARKIRGVIASGMTYKDDDRSFIDFIRRAFSKREFYNPVVIMIHLYTLSMWTGMVLLIVYVVDTLNIVVGKEVDVAFHVTILDIQRMVATVCASSIIKKIKRRTILFSTLGINLAALVALAVYTFAKANYTLPFDHPAIGIILLHIHMFSVTTGALPLPLIISGELFPLEFRSLAGGISGIAFSVNYFIASKTVFFLVSAVGIYGAYTLYAVITVYCMVVVWILLPETKDRTLQQIEENFKRKDPKAPEELAASLPLTSKQSKVDEVP